MGLPFLVLPSLKSSPPPSSSKGKKIKLRGPLSPLKLILNEAYVPTDQHSWLKTNYNCLQHLMSPLIKFIFFNTSPCRLCLKNINTTWGTRERNEETRRKKRDLKAHTSRRKFVLARNWLAAWTGFFWSDGESRWLYFNTNDFSEVPRWKVVSYYLRWYPLTSSR